MSDMDAIGQDFDDMLASTSPEAVAALLDGDGSPPPSPDDYGISSFPAAATPAPPKGEEADEQTLAECALLDHSDTSNARRLIRYFPKRILIMQAAGVAGGDVLTWSGRHWDMDNGAAVQTLLAQRVGDMIQQEADCISATDWERELIEAAEAARADLDALLMVEKKELTDEQRKRIGALQEVVASGKAAQAAIGSRRASHRKFGVTSKNAARIRAMLECAAPMLRKPIEEFNASALSVATLTHTIKFHQDIDKECPDPNTIRYSARIEAVEGHREEDYITALVPVRYVKGAKAKVFTEWIEKMMPEPEARRTLQQFSGISLLGVPLQRFMFHYGEGANGKSVFLELLVRLLGKSFAVGLPTESIIGGADRNGGSASPDLIRLFGKRMVRVLELPEGKPLQSELIKKLTGGEEIPVRTLFKGYIDFMPRAKPHMSGNGLPKITDTSNGLWRRMLFLRWPVTIAEADMRDPEVMVTEMLEEAPGILNWLCEGALDFLKNGLYIAPSVANDVKAYRREMDIVMQFVEDCVEKAPGEFVQARAMYLAFKDWCAANTKSPLFETKFGREMKRHCTREETRVRRYVDVKLRDDRPRVSAADKQRPPEPPHPADVMDDDEVPA